MGGTDNRCVPRLSFHGFINCRDWGLTAKRKCNDVQRNMKRKKLYSTPTIDVVEVNLTCSILSDSGTLINAQAEDGVWNGLESTESFENPQVEDGSWNGL